MQIDILAVDAAIGVLAVPHLTGLLTAPQTPGWVKSLVAVLASIIWALLHCWLAGALDLEQAAASIAAVIIFSGVSYQTITGASSRALQTVQLGGSKNGG